MGNSLAGSSYIKVPNELDHPRKGLINIQSINDNECFKCCFLLDTWILQITIQEELEQLKDFKGKKLPVKVWDIYKIERKNSIAISVFGYKDEKKYPIYASKIRREDKHVALLVIYNRDKKNFVLIKDYNAYMYGYTQNRWRKLFCC